MHKGRLCFKGLSTFVHRQPPARTKTEQFSVVLVDVELIDFKHKASKSPSISFVRA